MIYKIPVTWSCWGLVKIEADSLQAALQLVLIDCSLPDGEYIDDSIEIDEDSLEVFNPNK